VPGIAYPCMSRLFCPFCARAEVSRRLARLLPWVDANSSLQVLGMTATVHHAPGEPLAVVLDRLMALRKSLSQLWRDQRKGNVPGDAPLGGALSTEIVFHPEGSDHTPGWHPHFHAVLISEKRLDWKALNARADGAVKEGATLHFATVRELSDCVEWCKYGLKYGAEPWGAAPWSEAVDTLQRRQLLQSWGSFRGYVPPDRPRPVPDAVASGVETASGYAWAEPQPMPIPIVDCRTDRQKDAAKSRKAIVDGPKKDLTALPPAVSDALRRAATRKTRQSGTPEFPI